MACSNLNALVKRAKRTTETWWKARIESERADRRVRVLGQQWSSPFQRSPHKNKERALKKARGHATDAARRSRMLYAEMNRAIDRVTVCQRTKR